MYDTPEFQALRREYVQGALQRIAFLKEQVDLLRQGGQVDLRQLRQEVHKLRGSGGFYGFRELSEAAAQAEDTLIMVLDGQLARDDQQLAALVDRVIRAMADAAAQTGI